MRITLAAIVALFAAAFTSVLPVSADIVLVGSGSKTAYLTMVFDDAAPALSADSTHLFIVSFDGTITGEDLLKLAFPSFVTYLSTTAPAPPLPAGDAMRLQLFDFDGDGAFTDAFMDAASYSGDTGFTDPVDFDPSWTYWTRDDTTSAFATAAVGISGRTIDDGYHDAFVFGTFGVVAPPTAVPEPSSILLGLLLGVGLYGLRRP